MCSNADTIWFANIIFLIWCNCLFSQIDAFFGVYPQNVKTKHYIFSVRNALLLSHSFNYCLSQPIPVPNIRSRKNSLIRISLAENVKIWFLSFEKDIYNYSLIIPLQYVHDLLYLRHVCKAAGKIHAGGPKLRKTSQPKDKNPLTSKLRSIFTFIGIEKAKQLAVLLLSNENTES